MQHKSYHTVIDESNYQLVKYDTFLQKYLVMFDRQDYYDITGPVEGKIYVGIIEFDSAPNAIEIKEAISEELNKLPTDLIMSNFYFDTSINEFETHSYRIHLSLENQLNYFSNYMVALQTNGSNLPYRIKCGDGYNVEYFDINTVEEFTNLYKEICDHISRIQRDAWQVKDNIDWNEYLEYSHVAYRQYKAYQDSLVPSDSSSNNNEPTVIIE